MSPHLARLGLLLALLAGSVVALPEPGARVDRQGDPLPPGVLARLGTVRIRATFNPLVLYHSAWIVHALPDGKTVATATRDGSVRLWDPRTGEPVGCADLPETQWPVAAAAGRWLAIAEADGVDLLDLETGQSRRVPTPLARSANTLALSTDGKTLLLWPGPEKGPVRILDSSGRERCQIASGEEGVMRVALSPDGRVVATDTLQGVRLWDTSTGTFLRALDKSQGAQRDTGAIAFAPDGHLLAASRYDNFDALYLWDVTTGRLLCKRSREPRRIARIAFAPEGHMLAAVYTDDTFSVLATAALHERLHPDGKERFLTLASRGLLVTAGNRGDSLVRNLHAQVDAEIFGSPQAPKVLWEALAGIWTYPAVRRLVANGDDAVAFLGGVLHPVPVAEPRRIQRLIADLDNDDFDIRERASQELGRLGEQATPALLEAQKASPSAEQRRRLAELLAQNTGLLTRDQVRVLHAIEVLEEIATPAARDVLQRLAKGEPSAIETRFAQAARNRMGGRP
jgi:dipeptidyl aminopeptidase/acylaminoacyl peptidase